MFQNSNSASLSVYAWAGLVIYSAFGGYLALITGGITSPALLLLMHPLILGYLLQQQQFARVSARLGMVSLVLIGLFEIADLSPPEIGALEPLGLWLAIGLAFALNLIFFYQMPEADAEDEAARALQNVPLSGAARRFFEVLRDSGDAGFVTISSLDRVDQVFGAPQLVGDVQPGAQASRSLVDATGRALQTGLTTLPNGQTVCVLRHKDIERGSASLLLLRTELNAAPGGDTDLAEQLRQRTQFFAEFGHDLRSPLNAVIGFADIMANEIRGPVPEAYREYPGLIRDSGATLLSLIEDMLAYARSEVGTYRLRPEPTNVQLVAADVMRSLQSEADRAEVSLVWGGEADVWAQADPSALRRICDNLLSNAIKYSERGSAVHLTAERDTGSAVLSVVDTGMGIEANELDRIMSPFEQGANAKGKAGLGLGLALVRRLSELQGGATEIKSKPGKGTTVTVRLPLADAPGASEAAE